MTDQFNIHDYVFLWGDEDKEPMQIVGIIHYPDTEATYQLWATITNCLVGCTFFKHQLLPINE